MIPDFQDPIALPRCVVGLLGAYIDEMVFLADRYGSCTGTFNGFPLTAVKGQSAVDVGRPFFMERK